MQRINIKKITGIPVLSKSRPVLSSLGGSARGPSACGEGSAAGGDSGAAPAGPRVAPRSLPPAGRRAVLRPPAPRPQGRFPVSGPAGGTAQLPPLPAPAPGGFLARLPDPARLALVFPAPPMRLPGAPTRRR